ncbi:MAG: hypothetical protein A4S09_11230 [Proteobacteria bacterium SG_bin7]|nr:MAG: hypothetical protein A4S09_11230 [Proteobacteria bacterium SG_bin7]
MAVRSFLLVLLIYGVEAPASPFPKIKELMQFLNFTPYYESPFNGREVKIAILDNGFRGYENEISVTLPPSTKYHKGPLAPEGEEESHGLVMAQLVTALMTNDFTTEKIPYSLHLLSAAGYTNLAAAVKTVVEEKYDVVLYAQTWEYGGNFDGRGFINTLVNKAIEKGDTLWINAAGNFGLNSFNFAIQFAEDSWVHFPNKGYALHVRCETNLAGRCPLRAVLSWSDFSDDVETGTEKDLDFYLQDESGKTVGKSELQQKKEISEKEKNQEQISKYPREVIEADVKSGIYFLRVKAKTRNFSSRDRLRVTVSGNGVSLLQRDIDESLPIPADNSRVVTVGASDSDISSRSKTLDKPDIFAPSRITIENYLQVQGTSMSAAIVAAGAAILKSVYADMTMEKFLKFTRNHGLIGAPQIGNGLALAVLQFAPTGPGCFIPVGSFQLQGAVVVMTSVGQKVFVFYDPIKLLNGKTRHRPEDMIVYGPRGYELQPRLMQLQLQMQNQIEVVQVPNGQVICGQNLNASSKIFRMPRIR